MTLQSSYLETISHQTGILFKVLKEDRSEFRAKVQKFTYTKMTIPEQITTSAKLTTLLPANQKLDQVLKIWV